MNDFLHWFLPLWLYAVPNYVIILIVKCVDVFSYKKLKMTDQALKLLFLDLLVVEANHILVSGIGGLLAHWWNVSVIFSPLVLIPLFTVLPLIVLHFIEKKNTDHSLGRPIPPTRIVISDIVQALLFTVSYGCFCLWYSIASWEETMVIMGTVNPNLEQKWTNIFFIGILALILSFSLIKIIIQTIMVQKKLIPK